MQKVTSIILANKMIKELIKYQLRGRTYSEANPNQYTEDYNKIFDTVKSIAIKQKSK